MKLSARPQCYGGVPRDVTCDDVIDEEEQDRGALCDDVTETAEWRLSGLWIDQLDAASQLEPFVGTQPPIAAAGGAVGCDEAVAAIGSDDDTDADDFVGRRLPRRRCRPDLVPCQSPVPWHNQELSKTCSDVTALRRPASPVDYHCVVPDVQFDVVI